MALLMFTEVCYQNIGVAAQFNGALLTARKQQALQF